MNDETFSDERLKLMFTCCHPAVQRFWRQQQRIATRPQQTAEVAGRPALLSRFVSVLGAQQIAVASDRETLEILHIGEGASHD